MWRFLILTYSTFMVYGQQQNSRRPESYDNGHGWDIRLAVPGQPGADYPTLNSIPRTSFSCSGKAPGYYADVEAGCQVFRVCTLGSTYGFQSFLCPNGTLFNQEVLVCDWWMSVQCERSRLLFNENREKFGNLKLGPQLMKDIKKMLTHPMRYPYDKSIMKSNIIMMQDYKPPTGQLFPINALISGPERPPSNVYVPAKQRQGNFGQNSFLPGDLSFAASTPSSQYIPSTSNSIGPRGSEDIEILQQIRQSGTIPNIQGEKPIRTKSFLNNNIVPTIQSQNLRNIQESQNIPKSTTNNSLQRELPQYNNNVKLSSQIKTVPGYEFNSRNQQYTYITKQRSQDIQQMKHPQFSRPENSFVGREAKQNLVSPHINPPIGKTLKFSRIVQKSSSGNPKSRITFKTWIVRPPKAARLAVESTPYTYDIPENKLPTENKLSESYYKNLTTENPESENVPYVYVKPTPSNKQIATTVDETPPIYLPPTAPTFSSRLSQSKIPQLSKQSRLYLAPTTYKPASQLYVAPSENTLGLSRQYLGPNPLSPETINYQNARLVATPTSPVPDISHDITNKKYTPSFTLTKQSHINTSHNNLTFADILTKEKLDITVNDIVKDTNKILEAASPEELNQYRQNNEDSSNPPNKHLSQVYEGPVDDGTGSENPTTTVYKSEKIIATPSTELEPPSDTANYYQNSNKLSNLPFFKQPAVPTNTIERTVSLKITIPETLAEYIFKNHSDKFSDNLEILDTGSSNYLVLTNNHFNENNADGLIPIGKLIWDKNANISNSQALVYSFFADSINAAQEYSNIAKQNILSPSPTQSQLQSLNNEDLGDITDKISQLTSSHYERVNDKNIKNHENTKYTTELSQRLTHNRQENFRVPQQISARYSFPSRLQRLSSIKNNIQDFQLNSNEIYSGQLYKLPVPEVTSKIYNLPNLMQSSSARLVNELGTGLSLRDVNRDYSATINKQANKDVEVIPPENLPYPPARQQLPRLEESTFKTQDNAENAFVDNFINSDTGITAQVQDKIIGTLPHPLQENKLVTYQKNKSYYLYTKLDANNNDDIPKTNTLIQENDLDNKQNAKLVRSNDFPNRITFEMFPSIGYELKDETEKQRLLNALKINEFSDLKRNGYAGGFNERQANLVSGVDYTILHPSSRKRAEQLNSVNTLLYRGPSSYLAPQSSVGSLRENQQIKSNVNSRIEQFDDNNNNKGYSKVIPARQFLF